MPELALITGATGFVGTALARCGRDAGVRCLELGRRRLDRPGYHSVDLAAGSGALASLLAAERPDVVFHLAGGAAGDPFSANLPPMRHLLEAVRSVRGYRPRIVVMGSAAEYGDAGAAAIDEGTRELPLTEYGVAKLAQTRLALLARRAGLPVTVARAFNIIGPGMPQGLAAARFAREALRASAARERYVTVGDLTTVRDYLDVDDVALALWQLAESASAEPIVNVCSGTGLATGEVLAEIFRQVGADLEARVDPGLVRGAADVPVSIGSNRRLRDAIGREPRFSLPLAVRRLLAGAAGATPA